VSSSRSVNYRIDAELPCATLFNLPVTVVTPVARVSNELVAARTICAPNRHTGTGRNEISVMPNAATTMPQGTDVRVK
jgi:hypothetical protein